jgi:hypothetical protein
MLWFIVACLVVLWLIGWGFHVAGNLIHALLLVALVLALFNVLTRKRTV